KFVVERLLLDPLVTRLPPSYGGRYSYHINPNFRPGHVWHDIPPRYVESLVVGQNRIPDPAIARLFDDVQLATQAPLLAPGRFAAIWRLNTGHDYGTDAAWRNGAQPMRAQGRRPGASPASAVAPGQRG